MSSVDCNEHSIVPIVSYALKIASDRVQIAISDRSSQFGDIFSQSTALDVLLSNWPTYGFDDSLIEIVSPETLSGARAAYSASLDKIFLSEDLTEDAYSFESLVDALTEEFGHRIDALVNVKDTDGDEGRALVALVRGELPVVIADDDHGSIILHDGKSVDVEMSVSVSDSGGYEGSDQTLTLESKNGGTISYRYEHYGIPDRFIIRYEGQTLLDTGFVSYSRLGTLILPPGNSDSLSVIVATDNTGTGWNYSVTVDANKCQDITPWSIVGVTK